LLNILENNSNINPIGFFDSGVGGLSIWHETRLLMPNESTIYLADSLNAPYGENSENRIIELCIKNTELLLERGCKLIVVACNTATTNAIDYLRANYDVQFIGIEPATKPAILTTKTGKIGILATKGTLASELFLNTSKKHRGHVEIIEQVGKGLVKLIEENKIDATKPLLEKLLSPMIDKGVDNIVLGCSHYPFLRPIIEQIIPKGINIIDSGYPVAKQTKSVLEQYRMINNQSEIAKHHFYTNGDLSVLDAFVNKFELQQFATAHLNF
jgi:glutamate racemase